MPRAPRKPKPAAAEVVEAYEFGPGGFGAWAMIWSTDPATISGELQKLR